MNENQRHYLNAMGIDIWEERGRQPLSKEDASADTEETLLRQLDWDELETAVKNCTKCPLYKTRTNAVFGVGNRNADLLVVGEGPGANEDKQGEPFVGRGGQLLNSMLHSIGLARETVYIANVVKSRPPNNRDPLPEEVAACTPYLERQIELLKPKLIVAVGRVSAHYLLATDSTMGQLRGKTFTFRDTGIPLVVTYHPAYLLRSPTQKAKAMEDLQLIFRLLEELK